MQIENFYFSPNKARNLSQNKSKNPTIASLGQTTYKFKVKKFKTKIENLSRKLSL